MSKQNLQLFVIPLDRAGRIGDAKEIGFAKSRSGAIRAARAAGYRVVQAGGLIEVAPGEPFGLERDAWTVTVMA